MVGSSLGGQALDTGRIAVVGAGVIGLSTAVCISQLAPRCSITVVADKFTPDTTSDVAAGMLIPHTYPDTPVHVQKGWFRETFQHLSAMASSAEASEAGVHLVSGAMMIAVTDGNNSILTNPNTCLGAIGSSITGFVFRSVPVEEVPFWADIVLGFRKMTKAELQRFPQHTFGQTFTTLKCDTSTYLPWLEKRIKGRGGLLLTRRVEDLWELRSSFDVVVNCSGLGSRMLVGDSAVSPVKGQVLQAQAPWLKHFLRDESGPTYIYPGASHVTLGGTRQKGDWNLCPDAETSREIFSRCCALEPSLHRAWNVQEKVGLRPSRPGVRLQKELLARGGQRLSVVHNYGHGSGGVSVHWGCALEAARLVMECVQTLDTTGITSKL